MAPDVQAQDGGGAGDRGRRGAWPCAAGIGLSGTYSFRAEGSVTSSHTGTTYGFGYTEHTR